MSLATGVAGRSGWGSATSPTCCWGTLGAGTRWPASAGLPPGWSSVLRRPRARRGRSRSAAARGGGRTRCAGRAARRRRPLPMIVLTAAATWTVLGGRSLAREATAIAGPAGRRRPGRRPGPGPHLVGPRHDRARPSRDRPGLRSSRWPRTPPTPWSRRCCGVRLPASRVCWATGRSTPWTRWSATARRVTGGSAGRRRGWTTWPTGSRPGSPRWPRRCWRPLVGGSPARGMRVVRRDAGQHPSPNAGVVEAAFAGALGIRLGGRNVYGGQVEDRGTLGDGPPAGVADISRANRLARAVSLPRRSRAGAC